MTIVERFIEGFVWRQPTEDTGTWEAFHEKTYSKSYAGAERLKQVAWQSRNISSTVDAAMWAERTERWHKFLAGAMALSGSERLERDAVQYEFVACFLNAYASAEHNNKLWQAINESAVRTLDLTLAPAAADDEAGWPPEPMEQNPSWTLGVIPEILYNAFKRVNLSYYVPTEDTRTWAAFQEIMFDLTGMPQMYFIYRHAYLLTRVASTVDTEIWLTMATKASTLLDRWLGSMPSEIDAGQAELAISFCELFDFDYPRAAHNEHLFKAYQQAFARAREELQPYASWELTGSR